MKAILVVALCALVGLATAQQFYVSNEVTRLSPTKDEYFFCVPLGVVPTTSDYNLAIQYVLEKPTSIMVKYKDARNQLSLPQSIAVHTSELKTKTSHLPLWNEEDFLLSGCVSGVVTSSEPLLKVIVAFQPKDKETKEVPESSQTCGKLLIDAQRTEEKKDQEHPKSYRRPVPFIAMFSLSAGVALFICALISCCCLCCRKKCKQQQCCRNQAACAAEVKESTEMNVVTEQVPAVLETNVQHPQPVAAFYYVPASAVNGGQYTPMQFMAPSATAYPGNAHIQFVTPK